MESSNFDQIAQQIVQQKHLMDRLEEENRELRQQIADLITGRGIFVEVEGQRFALTTPDHTAMPDVPAVPAARSKIQPSDQQKPKRASVDRQSVPPEQETRSKQVANPASSFLEEALLDEFASAMTTPVQSVQNSQNGQAEAQVKNPQEQKERLRRELQGSYILE